jgi:hypothetical protein
MKPCALADETFLYSGSRGPIPGNDMPSIGVIPRAAISSAIAIMGMRGDVSQGKLAGFNIYSRNGLSKLHLREPAILC